MSSSVGRSNVVAVGGVVSLVPCLRTSVAEILPKDRSDQVWLRRSFRSRIPRKYQAMKGLVGLALAEAQ